MKKKSCQTHSYRILTEKKSEFVDVLGKANIAYNLIHVKAIQLPQHNAFITFLQRIYIYIFRKKNKELYNIG